MRPQQNRRMRGRGGNNPGGNNTNNNNNNNNNSNNGGRRGPNPLTRSYESNGPDVKIRGSAQQIAEKYTTLARDAQTSGDRVMAENYLQHAEHYNRIILTAQAQLPQPQVRDARDDDDLDDDGEENFNTESHGNQQPQQQPQHQPQQQPQRNQQPRDHGTGPQPVIEGVPAEVVLKQQDMGEQGSDVETDAQPEARKEAPRPRGRGRPRAEPAQEQPQAEASGEPAAEAGDAPAAEEQPVERKPRRPRRPRLKAGEEGAAEGEEPSGETVVEAAQ